MPDILALHKGGNFVYAFRSVGAPSWRSRLPPRPERRGFSRDAKMKAVDILHEAAHIVGGDREQTHGEKVKNFAAIAAVWNGVLEARRINGLPELLDGHDVASLMEAMKIARRYSGARNPDDYIDAAGYAGCAGEVSVSNQKGATHV